MTQTNAVAALGVVVTLDGNPIAEVLNVNGVSVSRKMLDATNFESPNYYEEAIAGLKSAKDVTLDMNFIAGDTNGQLALLAALEDGLAHSFVVTFPTKITATWTFSALVSDFYPGPLKNGVKIDCTATLHVTGQPVLAVGASAGLTTPFFAMNNSAVIVPAPANAVYDYVATVLTGVSSVTITPTAAAGVITVNGSVVSSGVPSSAIALGAAGSITIITVVVQETGKVAKTYIVRVARASA